MSEPDSRQVPISEAMRLAAEHQQSGRLAEADAIYAAVLAADARHVAAAYNRALIAVQTGNAAQGLPVLRQAVERDPGNVSLWVNYAVGLVGIGEPQAARQVLEQARRRGLRSPALTQALSEVERMVRTRSPAPVAGRAGSPSPSDNVEARLVDWYRQGRYADVVAQADALGTTVAGSPALFQVLGSSLLMQGQPDRACDLLVRSTSTFPDDAPLQRLLASALHRLGQPAEALAAIERGLALAPDDRGALVLASAIAAAMRDPDRAHDFARRALALDPDDVDAIRALADASALGGEHDAAVDLYRRVIERFPDNPDLFVNLGFSLVAMDRAGEAVAVLERALALRPDDAKAHSNLGAALFKLGETKAALEHHRRACDLAPQSTDAMTAYLFCLSHDESTDPRESYREHVRIGELIEAPRRALQRAHDNDRDADRVLRVGFVSADLRDHAVAYLIEPVWRGMRNGRYHVTAYANQPREDAVSERLRSLVDEWRRVERLDDEALAQRIRDDRIDILFDLSGHTTRNRLPVFAMKPAPVQVSWIGYPGTTGMASIDYRFVRARPGEQAEHETLFREKLVHLQHRLSQPEASAPPVATLPALARGHVTFGSFNRPAKISEATVELWARVLGAVPGSKLMVASASDESTRQRLRSQFAARGIEDARLSFRPRVPLDEYLALHHEVDIALDTLHYAGSTTTGHALWMGVPVVTLAGDAPQQRSGAFVLRRLGLDSWVTESPHAFVEQACRAAADLPALARLRERLRPLVAAASEQSAEQGARELDAALRSIWSRWCQGLEPASFTADGGAMS